MVNLRLEGGTRSSEQRGTRASQPWALCTSLPQAQSPYSCLAPFSPSPLDVRLAFLANVDHFLRERVLGFLWVKHRYAGMKFRNKAWVGDRDEAVTDLVPPRRPWGCTVFLGKKRMEVSRQGSQEEAQEKLQLRSLGRRLSPEGWGQAIRCHQG